MAILCQTCGAELATWTGKCPQCGGTMQIEIKAKADPMLNKVIGGRLKITKKLGQGGMGSVYLAEHMGVGQRVAIKFLNPSFSTDRNILQRFLNEARSYGQITHPHAVQLHDFGQDEEGNLFISMEYIEGQDLKKLLEQEQRLNLRDALDIVLQVCDVLGYAHGKGIVHRDLKPENIMLVKSLRGWHAKVLDFGVARLMAEQTRVTAAGSICGTPRYMAPEQAEGGDVDHRADIYALGLVLAELVTGVHPFVAGSIAETLRRQVMDPMPHLSAMAPDLKLPDALDAAIQKAVAKDREQRFPTMTDFAKVLVPLMPTSTIEAGELAKGVEQAQTMLHGEALKRDKTTHGQSPYDRPTAPASKLPLYGGIAAAALLLGGGGLWFALRPPEAPALGDVKVLDSKPEEAIAVPPDPKEQVVAADPKPEAKPDPGPGEVKPEVKPPEVAARPVPTPDPRPTPNPRPGNTTVVVHNNADNVKAATDEIRRVADQGILNSANTEYEIGKLNTAADALKGIKPESPVYAQAEALQKRIEEVQRLLGAAHGLYQKGDCVGATKAYEAVLAKNPRIEAASSAIARCKKQMLAPTIE